MPTTSTIYSNATHGYVAYESTKPLVFADTKGQYLDYIHWLIITNTVDKVPTQDLLAQLYIINSVFKQNARLFKGWNTVPNYLDTISSGIKHNLNDPNQIYQTAAQFGFGFGIVASVVAAYLMSSWPIAVAFKLLIGIGAAVIIGTLGSFLGYKYAHSKEKKAQTPTKPLATAIDESLEYHKGEGIGQWVSETYEARSTVKAMLLTRYDLTPEGLESPISDLGLPLGNDVNLHKLYSVVSRQPKVY